MDLDLVGQHLDGDAAAWWIMSERFRSTEPIKPGRRTASYTPLGSVVWTAHTACDCSTRMKFLVTLAAPCSRDFHSHNCFSVDAGGFRAVWFNTAIKHTFIGGLPCRMLRVTIARDAGFVRTIVARRVLE